MVKNQVLKTPSEDILSRCSDISKVSQISTPASVRHRQIIYPLLQPPLDDNKDSADDDEVNVNTDHEEDEDDVDIIEDDYIHSVSASVKQHHLETF